MKMMRMLGVASGAVLLAINLYAQAQPPADQGSSGAPSSAQEQSDKSSAKAARAADCALARQVRNAIVKDGTVNAVQIYLRVRDGAVILMGAVPEWSQGEKAVQIAKGIPGVKSVQNVLTIWMEA
jgi:hyperosmotically inducible protein